SYNVSSLAPGAHGQFSVRLVSKITSFPQTGLALTRPSGSGELYLSGNPSPISSDTASTLVVGPVLVVTKVAQNSPPIYPVVETATFTITIGNATGQGDID